MADADESWAAAADPQPQASSSPRLVCCETAIPDLTSFHCLEGSMAKRPKPVQQLSAAEFEALFPNENACRAYFLACRWQKGPCCPRCGNPAVYDLPSRRWHWQCERCTPNDYRFSLLVGTIFENTNKPLRDWFRVAHLMLTSKKGMSAMQIFRFMGFGSYKTAWPSCERS
jgi:transposase-like protein